MTIRVDEDALKELVRALNTLAPHLEPLRHEVKALNQSVSEIRLDIVKIQTEQKATKDQNETASKGVLDSIQQLQSQLDIVVTTIRGSGDADGLATRLRSVEAEIQEIKTAQELAKKDEKAIQEAAKKDERDARRERLKLWVALVIAGVSLIGVMITAIFGLVGKLLGGS